MDSSTREMLMKLIYVAIGIMVICFIILLVISIYRYVKSNNKARTHKGALWLNEEKSMLEPYLFDPYTDDSGNNIESTNPNGKGVSYTMNINILKWLYDKKVTHREIFTHGVGNFDNLGKKDIISVAIDAKKNDIIIKINTSIVNDGKDILLTSCEKLLHSEDEDENEEKDDITDERNIEIVSLKYVPIDEFFHISLVLSKKRIDVYKNGQLYGSKIFKGIIPNLKKRRTLFPIKFGYGKPIKGLISNFMYFEHELTIPEVKYIFKTGKKPDSADSSPQNSQDITMMLGNDCTLPNIDNIDRSLFSISES